MRRERRATQQLGRVGWLIIAASCVGVVGSVDDGSTAPDGGLVGSTGGGSAGDGSAGGGSAGGGSAGDGPAGGGSAGGSSTGGGGPTIEVAEVFFAQTHVMRQLDPGFKLIGGRDTLLKVQVVAPGPSSVASPAVSATLTLKGQTTTLALQGPGVLPPSFNATFGQVQHTASDSFMAMLPGAWISPGLSITLEVAGKRLPLPPIVVGAPTELVWTMLDLHLFGPSTISEYTPGWNQEFESKLPVAKLTLRRHQFTVFPQVVISGLLGGIPAVRISKPEDYQAATGIELTNNPKLGLTMFNWVSAISAAGGRKGATTLFYVSYYGINSVGIGGDFHGVQPGRDDTTNILFHEVGHALSLPHWGQFNDNYPYKGPMYGIAPPDTLNLVHVGPIWAFDARARTFLPPTVQPNNVGAAPVGTYKKDPMQGGGSGDQEPGFIVRHFSDFSVETMRDYLEAHLAVWSDSLGSYASWSQADGAYTHALVNNGVDYPIEREVDVITVMADVVSQNLPVNTAYPPIGPYRAGLIRRFEAASASDRQDAAKLFCPAEGCDTCLRVTQGGATRTYLLDAPWVTGSSVQEVRTKAINLRAADGPVTHLELLLTPDAQVNGLPASPTVLAEWVGP